MFALKKRPGDPEACSREEGTGLVNRQEGLGLHTRPGRENKQEEKN